MEDNSIEEFMQSLISEEIVESLNVMEDNPKEESVSMASKETKESPKIMENNLKEVSGLIATEETKKCPTAMKENLMEKPASSHSKETKETLLKMKTTSDSFDICNNPKEGMSLLSNNGELSQQEAEKLLKEYYNNLLNISFSPTDNCETVSPEVVEKFYKESYNDLNFFNEDARASNGKKRKLKNFSKTKEGLASQAKKYSDWKYAINDDQLIDVPITYECDPSLISKYFNIV